MATSGVFDAGIGAAAAKHIEHTMRRLLDGPKVRKEPGFVELLSGEPHPLGNFAIISDGSDTESTRRAMQAQLGTPVPTCMLFSSAPSNEVDEALLANGFSYAGDMPAMAVRIEDLSPTSLPGGYSFESVGNGALADEWAHAFGVGYELPGGLAAAFGPNAIGATARQAVKYYAAVKDGRIVSTSVIHLAEGLAGIYCVATVPEERGKGLGAHMTAEPLRLARADGYETGVLQSSEQGHSVYRKLGFEDVGGVPFYVRMPA